MPSSKFDWIPLEVQRIQAAMRAPVSDIGDINDTKNHIDVGYGFETCPIDDEDYTPPLHRDKIPNTPPLFNACVAKPVSRKERDAK